MATLTCTSPLPCPQGYICSRLPGTPERLVGLKHHLEDPFVFSQEVRAGSSLGLNLILPHRPGISGSVLRRATKLMSTTVDYNHENVCYATLIDHNGFVSNATLVALIRNAKSLGAIKKYL